MLDRLAIYRVSSEPATVAHLTNLGRRLFDVSDFQLSLRGNSEILRSGHRVVEIAGESGGIWAADESHCGNRACAAICSQTRKRWRRRTHALAEQGLLPTLVAPFRFGKPMAGRTMIAARR